MTEQFSRRDFVKSGAAAVPIVGALSAATAGPAQAAGFPAPFVRRSQQARPCVVASANGMRAVQRAYDLIQQGMDTLDAIVEGVKIQELDPNDQSVGFGGLPNQDDGRHEEKSDQPEGQPVASPRLIPTGHQPVRTQFDFRASDSQRSPNSRQRRLLDSRTFGRAWPPQRHGGE